MPQPWIVEECRRQAVMYLADAAVVAGRGPAAACPRPLVPPNGRLAMAIAAAWKDALGRRQRPADVAVVVATILGDAEPSGFPQSPWTIGELVGWWLAAGESLARHDSGWRDELERVLGVAATGGQPAALWCADRWSHYGLNMRAFTARRSDATWEQRPEAPVSYVRKLIDWVASKDRQRPNRPDVTQQRGAWIDAMGQEGAPLAEDARRLLGTGCEWKTGESLTLATVSDWVAVHWCDTVRGDRAWEEVRRPVVDGSKRMRRPVPGWVVCRPPVSVLQGLFDQPSRIAMADDTMEAALQFAARLWPSNFLPSQAWPRGPGRTVADPPVESQAAFLAVARVLAALEMAAEVNGDDGQRGQRREELRVALALDGFSVAAGGDPGSERLIPRIGMPSGGASRPLHLVIRRSPGPVAIGRAAQEASSATRLSRAVEELDWRVWHLDVIGRSEPKRRTQQIAHIACQSAVKVHRWEEVKRRLVVAGMDAAAVPLLVNAFGYAHRRRLSLELLRRKAGADPTESVTVPALDSLIDAFRELAAAILERLQVVEAGALSRLVPPRRADGSVDGIAWLMLPQQPSDNEVACDFHWCSSDRPLGEAFEEHRGDDGRFRVFLSSGAASDADVRLLNTTLGFACTRLAEVAVGGDRAWADLVQRLAARIKERVASAAGRLDLGDDVAWLCERCATDDAAAFHSLISGCLNGDAVAAEWCRVLAGDPRFAFAIHPSVELSTGVLPKPAPEDEHLRWDFHPTIPAGSDITVQYGVISSRAVRVVSRGPRVEGSPADRADALEVAAAAAGAPIDAMAAKIRMATDRWIAFPEQAAHPALAAVPLLRSLIREDAVPPAIRSSVFAALVAWAEGVGHEVVPGSWSPERPTEAAALPRLASAPMFHEGVPEGCLVLGALGLEGECGVPADAAVSVGPPPSGYVELRQSVESLVGTPETGHNPSWVEAAQRVRDLPRHAIGKTLALAGPNLYDCVWEAATTASDAGDPRIDDVKERIVLFLKAACGMVTFHPTTPRDFASGWVQEVGGSPPRGRRIRLLVRPGVRTLGNALVRPALVITE